MSYRASAIAGLAGAIASNPIDVAKVTRFKEGPGGS